MIGFLRGEVLEHSEGRLLILAGGVGYAVSVPGGGPYAGLLPGTQSELYIHTHVREDTLDLYGFASRAEKEVFLTLLGVTGIGPKVAMAILTASDVELLIQAILEGDTASLTRIPGVGKKTAERVALELPDKLKKKLDAGLLGSPKAGLLSGRVLKGVAGGGPRSQGVGDAQAALIGLGYREPDVTAVLKRIVAELGESAPKRPEELVRLALREML